MKKQHANLLIYFILWICFTTSFLFAANHVRTMRIGESQYFDIDGVPGEDIKITLKSVQNGIAVLEKEYLQNQVSEIQYFFAAQGSAEAVAPIWLQPYLAQVSTEIMDLRGICEPGLELRLYRGSSEDFGSAVWLQNAQFIQNGSNFEVSLPLVLGSNYFFIAYAPGVIGARVFAGIERVKLPTEALSVDLDPIGSLDVRKTRLKMKNTVIGKLEIIETILGAEQNRLQQTWNEKDSLLEIENSYTHAFERSFHLTSSENNGDIFSQKTIVLPVDEEFPKYTISDSEQKITPGGESIHGNFSDNLGVRFAWVRLIDGSGKEISRAFIDLGKLSQGFTDIAFVNSAEINLKIYANDQSVLGETLLKLPQKSLLAGEKYRLETGVTDIAGNRSPTYSYEVCAFTFEKEWIISLVGAIPRNDVNAYPLLLRIGEKEMDFSTASVTGSDLRFLDSEGNPLVFEIERFNAKDKEAEVWIRIPRIAAGTNHIRLKMLWGNSEALSESKISGVWDDGFRGVYHFNEEFLGPYIPETNFSEYTLYATKNATFKERSNLYGIIAASGVLNLGMDTKVYGDVFYGFALNQEERVSISGRAHAENLIPLSMPIVPLPSAGTHDINVSTNSSITLLPGKYGDLILNAGSQISLSSGTYHFRNVTLFQDAKINTDISRGIISVKIQENLNVTERSQVRLSGNSKASMVRFDVLGNSVVFGTDVVWKGILTAPNATVIVKERMVWTGALYAQNIFAGTDVSFIPALSEKYYPSVPADDEVFPPATLAGFDLFAKENISFQNQSQITGRIGSLGNTTFGNDVRLYGDALVYQNLTLGNQSVLTGSILLGGSVQENANVNWSGSVTPLLEKPEYLFPEIAMKSGSESIVVNHDQIYELAPGSYQELTIRSRGKLKLLSGVYHFSNINIENDAVFMIESLQSASEIYVGGRVSWGDRVQVLYVSETPHLLKLYFAGTHSVRLGSDTQMKAIMMAPEAEIILADRVTFSGRIWAHQISIGNGCSFTALQTEGLTSEEKKQIELAYSSDYIIDAARFKHHGINTQTVAKNGWIAKSEQLQKSTHISFAAADYFKNNIGSLSFWVRFDGASGRFLSSANVSLPNWEWKRTLEGNVIIKIGSSTFSFPVPENRWVHLAFVQNQIQMLVYVNGVLQERGKAGSLLNSLKPWLGLHSDGLIEMDEFRISEVDRNEDWIRLDYHTQKKNDESEAIMEFARSELK